MDSTGNLSETHPYTCNSCAVAFRGSEAQRTHMRGDWHRYNLKRRVASLPPISSEVFDEKVLSAQATTNAAAAKASFERNCDICQKTYFSENAYKNHIGSQKHKLRVAASAKGSAAETGSIVSSTISLGEPIELASPEKRDPDAEAEFEKVVHGLKSTKIEEEPHPRRPSRPHHSSAENKPEDPLSPIASTPTNAPSEAMSADIPLSRCLFCNYDSPNWKLSVTHMTKIHGLFIPEQTYLVDLEGLLRYFQAKIIQNHECLYCHKLKGSTSGVQTHMRDKGHCMVAFETEEEMVEVGQFYDFSSTYSDPEDGSDTNIEDAAVKKKRGRVKLPDGSDCKEGANVEEEDEEEEEEEEWETDSSFSSLDSENLTSVPIDDHTHQYERLPLNRHHSHTDPRPHKSVDGFHSHAHHHANAVYYDDYEMHLPNGRTLGHRSLKKYYRQNLHNYPSVAERVEKARRKIEEGNTDDDEEMEDIPDSPQMHRSQAIGRRHEMGMLGATSVQRRHALAAEKRDRKRGEQQRNKYQAKLEKQNNQQKHFRDPLLQ